MEEKKRKNIRRKFCWYDLVLIISIVCVILLFSISKSIELKHEWYSNLLMSVAASWLLAAVLTYIFAWINERGTIIEMANREINEVYKFFAFVMNILPSLSEPSQNNNGLKEIILNRPYFYALNKMYPSYTKECYTFVEGLETMARNGELERALSDISEVINSTMIIQELLDQEYLGEEKRPIKSKLITRINDPIKDYGTLYSGRRRKFKEE